MRMQDLLCRLLASLIIGAAPAVTAAAGTPGPGVDPGSLDTAVRAQDDLYRYANGHWLSTATLPPDQAHWSVADALQAQAGAALHGLLEAALKDPGPPQSERHQLADLYASFLDEKTIEARGLRALRAPLRRIGQFDSRSDIAGQIGWNNRHGFAAPFQFAVLIDPSDPSRHALALQPAGLGLGEPQAYLQTDPRNPQRLGRYRAHIVQLLQLAGEPDAAARAGEIIALETRMAQAQISAVSGRGMAAPPVRFAVTDLDALMPRFDWTRYLKESGVGARASELLVRQTTYLNTLSGLIEQTPVAVWKAYFKWQLIHECIGYLPQRFVRAEDAFRKTTSTGVAAPVERRQEALELMNATMGAALGRLYGQQYFPEASRARVQQIAANVTTAVRERLDELDWLSSSARLAAQQRLTAMSLQLGYPEVAPAPVQLKIDRTDLLGNVRRVRQSAVQAQLDQLGQPVTPQTWSALPQQVLIRYAPDRNLLLLSAALLQPPLFDAGADEAANYGAIGALIGRELSLAVGDWSGEDRARFTERVRPFVGEYSRFETVPGQALDGEVTLTSNVADNAGLALAYRAYQLSLAGEAPAVIGDFSGDQRFYLGYAQSQRALERDAGSLVGAGGGPQAPAALRVRGAVVNQESFYAAFAIKPEDLQFVAPEARVRLW